MRIEEAHARQSRPNFRVRVMTDRRANLFLFVWVVYTRCCSCTGVSLATISRDEKVMP